jgi:hypothetical protein
MPGGLVNDLPLWFRITVLSILIVCLVAVLVADMNSDTYEAQATALALVGVIGAAIAADQLKKGGGDQ